MIHRSWSVLVIALFLAAPAATATWYVKGTAEPDTAQDAEDGYMYNNPDTDANPAVRQAYFNAWAETTVVGTNPNVGATGSAISQPGVIRFAAMLGVWKDCNDDGFVGMADGALWEYRVELLDDQTICGDTTHIVGDWVWEFHWIGPGDAGRTIDNSSEDYLALFGPQGFVNDTEARMWGDWGLPGDTGTRTCPVAPTAGTTASTGGMIDWADCLLGRQIQGTINAADSDGSLGLRMDGKPQTSDSELNQQLPHLWHDPYHPDSTGLYERESDDPAFSAWDCSSGETVPVSEEEKVRDETGQLPQELWINDSGVLPNYFVATLKDEDGTILTINERNVNYTMPNPAVHNPQGSYWDGVNQTSDGTLSHCGDEGRWDAVRVAGSDAADLYVNPESSQGSSDEEQKGRNQHHHTFRYWPTQGNVNWAAFGGCTGYFEGPNGEEQPFPPGCLDYPTQGIFTDDMPDDFGVQAHRTALGIGWSATGTWARDPQLVDRNTLAPQGPRYMTFYASVGDATLSKGITPPDTVGVYGSEWCETGTSAVFDCDADNWWDPINHPGTSPMPRYTGGKMSSTCTTGLEEPIENCRELGVKPGQPYQFRDIDCWDGRVSSSAPVYASLVTLSGQGACALPPQ